MSRTHRKHYPHRSNYNPWIRNARKALQERAVAIEEYASDLLIGEPAPQIEHRYSDMAARSRHAESEL